MTANILEVELARGGAIAACFLTRKTIGDPFAEHVSSAAAEQLIGHPRFLRHSLDTGGDF